MCPSRPACVSRVLVPLLLVAACAPDEPAADAPDVQDTGAAEAAREAEAAPTIPAPAAPRNAPGDPDRRDALFAQAERLAALHDDARAIRKLEKALAAGPEDARTRRLLGLVKLRRNSDVVAARADLRRAAALDPTDVEPHLLLASLALEMGDAAAARAHVDDALLRDPERPQARVLDARLLAQAGEDAAALERLDALISSGAGPADACLERGKLRLRGGDAAGALADLERARELAPTDTRVRFNVARALRRLGRSEEAAAAQEEFELLRPVFSLAKHDRELDPARRLERLRAIEERFPRMWQARLERARTEISVEGPAIARRTLEAARDAFPDEPEIRALLARLLDHLGEPEAAAREREAQERLGGEGDA